MSIGTGPNPLAPGRLRCLLVVGVPLFTLIAAVVGVAWAWLQHDRELDRELEGSRDRLARLLAVGAQRPALEAAMRALEDKAKDSDYYVAGDKTTLAAAELQNRIKTVVESHNGSLISTQSLPASVEGDVTKIAVRIRMRGDVESLVKTLHELEDGKPYVSVENISVRATTVARSRLRQKRTGPTAVATDLNSNFDVYGYMRGALE